MFLNQLYHQRVVVTHYRSPPTPFYTFWIFLGGLCIVRCGLAIPHRTSSLIDTRKQMHRLTTNLLALKIHNHVYTVEAIEVSHAWSSQHSYNVQGTLCKMHDSSGT